MLVPRSKDMLCLHKTLIHQFLLNPCCLWYDAWTVFNKNLEHKGGIWYDYINPPFRVYHGDNMVISLSEYTTKHTVFWQLWLIFVPFINKVSHSMCWVASLKSTISPAWWCFSGVLTSTGDFGSTWCTSSRLNFGFPRTSWMKTLRCPRLPWRIPPWGAVPAPRRRTVTFVGWVGWVGCNAWGNLWIPYCSSKEKEHPNTGT